MDTNTLEQQTRTLIEPLVSESGPLLLALHTLQDHFGYIPPESVPCIAQILNLSRAEVHGVISFYHSFRSEPPGKKIVSICRAESCQAMGSADLEARAKKVLGIDFHQTSADGLFSLEPVYCLGNCACSPAIMIDDQLHSRVSLTELDQLLEVESS
ncbi:MAG: formate dehydrogenase subunit gamma [Halioglobus sp.]